MTAQFDSSPGSSYVTDVTAWNGGFVAIGSAWETEYRVNDETPAMWTSPDGESWEQVRIDLGADDVTLIGLEVRADGRLLLVGAVPGSGATAEPEPPGSMAWVSDDGVTWQEIRLPLAEGTVVDSVTHGPKGYALGARTPYLEFAPGADQTPGELWHSTNGIDWTRTFEGASRVVAGDDGFVAIVTPLAAGPSSVVASGDGKTWYSSGLITAPLLSDVAPLGGDWLVNGSSGNPATIMVYRSANGLDWLPVLDVNDLTGPDGPKTGRGLNELAINEVFLTGGAGYAFLMLGNNHCCAQMGWTYGVWETTDGTTWTPALGGAGDDWTSATRADPFVSSVAMNGATIVLGGHLGRGLEAAFWIHER